MSRRHALPVAVVVAFTAVAFIPDFFLPGGSDWGAYFLGGYLIDHGQTPYTDFFVGKTPGIYGYASLWQLVFGSSWYSAKAALLPLYVAFGVSTYVFSATLFRARWWSAVAGCVAVFLALTLEYDASRNASTVVLAAALGLLSLALVYSRDNAAAAGVLAALAFLTRQGVIWPFLGAAWYLRRPVRPRAVARFAAGAAAPLVLCVAVALVLGIDLQEAYRQIVTIPRYYNGGRSYQPLGTLPSSLRTELLPPSLQSPLWLLALAGLVLVTVRRSWDDAWTFAFTSLVVAAAVVFLSTGPTGNGNYYWLPYAPWLVVVAVESLRRLVGSLVELPRAQAAAGALAVVAVLVVLIGPHVKTEAIDLHRLVHGGEASDVAAARIVRSHLRPGDTMFADGTRDWLYFLAGAKPPTLYYDTLLFGKPTTRAEFDDAMRDFARRRPRVIVDDEWRDTNPATSPAYRRRYLAWLRRNYRLAGTVPPRGFERVPSRLYVLRGSG
jgi:hypothetical protein